MSAFSAAVSRGAKNIFEKKIETSFLWKGDEYPCSVNHTSIGFEAEDAGGIDGNSRITVNTLGEYFDPTPPKIGAILVIDGVEWTVDREPISQSGTDLYILSCSRPDGTTTVGGDFE
jgi:hypothetical protein